MLTAGIVERPRENLRHPNVPADDGPPAQGVLRVGNVEVPVRSGTQGPGTWLTDNLEGGPGSGLTRAWGW